MRLFEAELLPFDIIILCAQLLLHRKSDWLETFKDDSVSCEDVRKALIFPVHLFEAELLPFDIKILCAQLLLHRKSDWLQTFTDDLVWCEDVCEDFFFHVRLFEAELLPFDVKILCAQLLLHRKSDWLETFTDDLVWCEDVHKDFFTCAFLKRSYCPLTLKSCVRNSFYTVSRIDFKLSQMIWYDVKMCAKLSFFLRVFLKQSYCLWR